MSSQPLHDWLMSERPASRRQAALGRAYAAWRGFARNRLAMGGLAIVLALVGMAACADWIAPYSPTEGDLRTLRLLPPSAAHWFGTDDQGRDILSRIIHGSRISLTIGILGVAMSFVLGIVIGGLAGYYGGWIDAIVQRVIEVLQSIPSIPLWMALAAIMPVTWSPLLVYAGITIILGMLDWTGLARAVRSKLLALREEDYVQAAQILGAKPGRIIGRHLVPGFMSHLVASATLTIPGMILGETALSFLGLGLRPPVTSWGILLTEARSVNTLALYPWLLFPVLPVVLVILAFNFLGDGLRDAADPLR